MSISFELLFQQMQTSCKLACTGCKTWSFQVDVTNLQIFSCGCWSWLEIDQYIDRSIFGFFQYISAYCIGLSRCWQNADIFHKCRQLARKRNDPTKSRQLFCSNSKCIFINKQPRWTMERVSAVTAETNASSLTRLIKNHSKILKLLQFDKF